MLIWFVWFALIFSLLAPLFRRMRDTFSQFESGLKISPPSGKAVIDLFDDLYTYFEAREAPLSALRATLPEGVVTSSVGYAATFPKGEGGDLFRQPCRRLPRGGRRGPLSSAKLSLSPKGKVFLK